MLTLHVLLPSFVFWVVCWVVCCRSSTAASASLAVSLGYAHLVNVRMHFLYVPRKGRGIVSCNWLVKGELFRLSVISGTFRTPEEIAL